MKKLLRILIVNSVTDLFKHKSFFFLIFILILVDRGMKMANGPHKIKTSLQGIGALGLDRTTTAYVFDTLPGVLWRSFTDYRVFLVLGGLFLLKQIISLWPSSDLRRMHRSERGVFGIMASLAAIRRQQIAWDAVAVSTLCFLALSWAGLCYGLHRLVWLYWPSPLLLISLGGLISLVFPMVLAGFSYSSKLAVLSRGRFGEKLALFCKLFTDPRVITQSWLFFFARIVVEAVFVAAIPAYILITMKVYWLRILLAAVLATPVYSYLKMASFKFFLVTYRPFELVKQEYEAFYRTIDL